MKDIRQMKIPDGERALLKAHDGLPLQVPAQVRRDRWARVSHRFRPQEPLSSTATPTFVPGSGYQRTGRPARWQATFGLGRHLLAVLVKAYAEDELGGEKRVFLKFPPHLAPIKAAVFPLQQNKPSLCRQAHLRYMPRLEGDPAGSCSTTTAIQQRYRRRDEIGTPWCITIDFDTLGENLELKDTVTLRDTRAGEQKRVAVMTSSSLLLPQLKV